MHTLVKTTFTRLYILDPEEEERKLADNDGPVQEEAKLSVSVSATTTNTAGAEDPPSEIPEEPKEPIAETPRAKC